jgi:hypothetical protein
MSPDVQEISNWDSEQSELTEESESDEENFMGKTNKRHLCEFNYLLFLEYSFYISLLSIVVAQKDFTNSLRKLIKLQFPKNPNLAYTEYVKIAF